MAHVLDADENQSIDEEYAQHISFREVDPVTVRVQDLAVKVDVSPSVISKIFSRKRGASELPPTSKTILHDVNASMPPGSLTAILGGSGSGKTTMLNLVAERMSGKRLKKSGVTTFNGQQGIGNVRSAYVMQQDVLLHTLTVRETLRYSADLRLPPPTTKAERRKIVEEVILELGLKEAADTKIGNHAHKGCSGGEKRRTSIGIQLLSNPSVLFLDEPTTGLDATSAFQLIRTLKTLARKGRTIITTIHQPRSEIWSLFDNLIVLSHGSPVYSGRLDRCLQYFKDQGMEPEPFVNPAEFIIDLAAIDNRSPELEAASTERVQRLQEKWKSEGSHYDGNNDDSSPPPTPQIRKPTSCERQSAFIRQTRVLTARTFKITIRDPFGVTGSLFEAVIMAVVTGWVFFKLGTDQSGIRSRQGALYTSSAFQGYLILIFETYRLSIDIAVFDREHGEGVVGAASFLISRRLARFFLEDLPVPFIFSIIFYYMAGFQADAARFLIYFSILLLSHFIALTLATACIAADRTFAGASLIANMAYTVQSMACGYFIQSNTIPVYVRWLKWTAYVFYAFGGLCANEFVGSFYSCPLPGGESNPACAPYTGKFIMESLGLPENWVWRPIAILAAFSVVFYTLAGIGLHFLEVKTKVGKSRHSEGDLSAGKEKLVERSKEEIRTIDIGLAKFAMKLEKRNIYGKKLPVKTILQPVTTLFKPGMLNVIMGPSGSGKTSLLNAMALRNKNSIGTQYLPSGKMTFNGAVPSESVIRSVCSYVCQDDDALLPSLTVRETLRFAAGLRLPSHMSKDEKNRRAEEVLLKMGLKDCSDNLIGNELIKGISGGEKRRVTISVQLLSNPLCLLLDEPTSGLDAFTANSIMEVLQGLALEGRTIIFTIHQARSDLFKHFGNVLLLARGGSPVYAGPGSEMLAHFSSHGHDCSENTNPADFALDLITVDLQQEDKEEASRDRVRQLIISWNNEMRPISSTMKIATPAELGALKRPIASFWSSYPILLHRALLNLRRQPATLLARSMQVVSLGAINALFFAPLKNDYFSIQNRLGFIQQFGSFYFVGMLQNLAVYPNEAQVFYREHDDGAYTVSAFFAQYTSCEVPFEIIASLVSAVLADIAIGFPRTIQVYFVCFFNGFCIVSCGESLGIMFNTLFSHTGFAVNVTSVFLSIAMTMTGILSINMPGFLKAVNYLSPLGYSARNLAPYTLRSIEFTCTNEQRLPDGSCTISTGYEVLDLFNLNVDPRWQIMGLGLCTLIYRILAFMLLKAKRTQWSGWWREKRSRHE